MNGLALILAVAVGQQWDSSPRGQFGRYQHESGWPAGVQVIPTDPDEQQGEQLSKPHSALEVQSVRIGADGAMGSGTIIHVESEKAYVITAKHVVRGIQSQRVQVRHFDERYDGKLLGIGQGSDLAVIEMPVPPGAKSIEIAPEIGKSVTMIGWGGGPPSRTAEQLMHAHRGRYLRPMRLVQERGPDVEYGFYPEPGDSGGGVFDEQNRFAGVVWGRDEQRNHTAAVVSCAKVHKFLGATIEQTAGGKRIVTISPFFLKFRREWSDGNSSQATCPPVQGGSITGQSGNDGRDGVDGKPGRDGVDGKPGKDGKDVDPATLAAILKATQANAEAISQLTVQVQQIKAQPAPQMPLLRMTALNAAGQPQGSKTYEPTIDPATGRLIYDVKMTPSTLLNTQP